MNHIGTVNRIDTLAGQPVAEVAVDSLAPGYVVSQCEVSEDMLPPVAGDRVLIVPVGPGDAQWVVVCRLP